MVAARAERSLSKMMTRALGVALELEREQGEERALAGAGGADDERVADVLDSEVQAERACRRWCCS